MDTKVIPDAYGVWDTQEKRWWRRNNKRSWVSKSAAANAWNAEEAKLRYWRNTCDDQPKPLLFSQQKRFVTKGIRFEAVD